MLDEAVIFVAGQMLDVVRLPVIKLSIAMTRCPSASSRSVRCEPRNPAPPVTTETGLAEVGMVE